MGTSISSIIDMPISSFLDLVEGKKDNSQASKINPHL